MFLGSQEMFLDNQVMLFGRQGSLLGSRRVFHKPIKILDYYSKYILQEGKNQNTIGEGQINST